MRLLLLFTVIAWPMVIPGSAFFELHCVRSCRASYGRGARNGALLVLGCRSWISVAVDAAGNAPVLILHGVHFIVVKDGIS